MLTSNYVVSQLGQCYTTKCYPATTAEKKEKDAKTCDKRDGYSFKLNLGGTIKLVSVRMACAQRHAAQVLLR